MVTLVTPLTLSCGSSQSRKFTRQSPRVTLALSRSGILFLHSLFSLEADTCFNLRHSRSFPSGNPDPLVHEHRRRELTSLSYGSLAHHGGAYRVTQEFARLRYQLI